MTIWPNEDGIASHGCSRWGRSVIWVVETCIIVTASDNLEDVAVQVERVSKVMGLSTWHPGFVSLKGILLREW